MTRKKKMIVKSRLAKFLLGVVFLLFAVVISVSINQSLKREPKVSEKAASDQIFD